MPAPFGDSTPSKYYFADQAASRLYFSDYLIWTSFTEATTGYTTTGTSIFTAPIGTTKADLVGIGGGAGAGGSGSSAGPHGRPGTWVGQTISISGGSTLSVTPGPRGSAGAAGGGAGGAGSASTVYLGSTLLLSAAGGASGSGAATNIAASFTFNGITYDPAPTSSGYGGPRQTAIFNGGPPGSLGGIWIRAYN